MTIQGMSQGLAFSNMSYYMHDEIPAITACDTPPLIADGAQAVYNTAFDMGTASGAGIIVFEVGYPRNDSPTTQPIMYALGDKLEWHYQGNRSSEYSFAQVGESQPTSTDPNLAGHYVDDTGASKFRLMGRGYARGIVGTGFNPDGTPVSTRNGINTNDKGTNKNLYGNKATPLNPYVGSKLLPRTNPVTTWTQPYLVDPAVALSTSAGAFTTQAYQVCDIEFSTGGQTANNGMQSDNTVYPGTKAVACNPAIIPSPNSFGMAGTSVMTFGTQSQHNGYPGLSTNLSQHGSFVSYVQGGNFAYSLVTDGMLTYDWTNGIPLGTYGTARAIPTGSINNANLVKQFAGPYTGHDEPEIANPFSNVEYAGSSAVTIDYGRYAMRQGMMVVPVGNGGIVRCRLEAPFAGTFAEQKIFCPITLPQWGGATGKMGYSEKYTNGALQPFLHIVNGASQSASDHIAVNGNSATTTLSMATNNFNKNIKVNHLITGAGIAHGTIVTAVLDQVDNFGSSLVGGTGYSVGTNITTNQSTQTNGTGLTLDITAISANVTTFNVTNAGNNYNTLGAGTGVQGTSTGSGVGFTCSFFVNFGGASISNVVMTSGGSGHVVGNVLQIQETSNTGAGNTAEVTVTAIGAQGVITAVSINAHGTGYDVGDVLIIGPGGFQPFAGGTVTVSHVYYELTLSIAATIANSATINFHRSKLRESFDTYNELKLNLGQSPETFPGSGIYLDYYDINNTSSSNAPAANGQRGTGHFFNLFSSVAKIKPYATAALALAHWGGGATAKSQTATAYHVPSQNAKYRGQGYPNFKAGGVIGANAAGGGPESNHGHHVLSNHGTRPLAWNTLNATDALAHHGIVNEADWVFTRSNGAARSRLPARGIIDMTKYADNDWDTVGGWYAMKIGSNSYAVQVGSLDYSRGEITVDVIPATAGTSGTVPRNGVARTVTT